MKANSLPLWQAVSAFTGAGDQHSLAGVEPDRKREQRLTLVILAVAGLARLPFLWHGFGGHPDEWLVIRSGLDFWLHGTYYPSRPAPGFPLNEILMGGLAWLGGETACAAAATLASLVMLAYMRRLAPLHGIRDSFWMVLAFSFEPWVWVSGTHGLDYIWGTAALVAAVYYIEERQFGPAGLACAIGFGFRPSSLLWIGPLFIRALAIERRWRGVLTFVLWTAVPALIPVAIIASAFLSRNDVYASTTVGWIDFLHKTPLVTLSALAGYRFVELFGHIPAFLIITAACLVYRDQLSRLFRCGEGWVWNYLLIFVCLLPTFVIESSKPEYMLPALPGLFMILGRCISRHIWWQAITAAFIFNAFVSFGFGHAPHAGGLRLEIGVPSLRPGSLLWYADVAKTSNDRVIRAGSELSEPDQIVRADPEMDRLDDFYVSSLLTRGPPSQAHISCPLVPAFLSFSVGSPPRLSFFGGLPWPPPSYYPILICCKSTSGLILSNTPAAQTDSLRQIVRGFCEAGGSAQGQATP